MLIPSSLGRMQRQCPQWMWGSAPVIVPKIHPELPIKIDWQRDGWIWTPTYRLAVAHVQSNANNAGASGTVLTVALTGVGAGNGLAAFSKWEGGSTTYTLSDGTSTFSQPLSVQDDGAGNPPYSSWAYLLSANSGDKTFTQTLASAQTFRVLIIFEFSGGPFVLDGTPAHHHVSGSSAVASPAITTTGTDGIGFGYYAPVTGTTISLWLINGVSASNNEVEDFASMWCKTYTAGFTGTASATLDGAPNWNAGVMAFKADAGGGDPEGSLMSGKLVNGLLTGGVLVP